MSASPCGPGRWVAAPTPETEGRAGSTETQGVGGLEGQRVEEPWLWLGHGLGSILWVP